MANSSHFYTVFDYGCIDMDSAKRKRNVVKNIRKRVDLTVKTVQSFSVIQEILISKSCHLFLNFQDFTFDK